MGVLLNHNTSENRHADVVLLSPPFDYPPRPSLALSLLKPHLTKAGFSSVILYPMVRMCALLGKEIIDELYASKEITLFEEYIFSGLTGKKDYSDLDEYIKLRCLRNKQMNFQRQRELMMICIKAAAKITAETAEEIASFSPKVLAATSMFTQQNASLAILKQAKERVTGLKTIMGGPNCSGQAGLALLKYYPQVDAVCFGEGDEVIVDAVNALIKDESMPYGVLRSCDVTDGQYDGKPVPFRLTKDLNKCLIPDYDDFLPYIEQIPEVVRMWFFAKVKPEEFTIMMEGSRGCWWGQKHPCTFCTLNGEKNVYRTKTPQRVFDEMISLAKKYQGANRIEFTDNVISGDLIRDLPNLMQNVRGIKTVAEVKPSLTEEQVFALRAAGFAAVQTGIESLNGHLIRLMGKGNTPVGHIAFLKACRRSGLSLIWNVLYRIPGENAEDYEMLCSLFPLLHHLPPPTAYSRILFERGSCYHKHPEQYDLELDPDLYYRYVFGEDKEITGAMALYYEVSGGPYKEKFLDMIPLYNQMIRTVLEWRRVYWQEGGCHLIMSDRNNSLVIADTRPCRKAALTFLSGLDRELCLMCDRGMLRETVEERLADRFTPEMIDQSIQYLKGMYYMVEIEGRLLALPTINAEL